VTLAKPAPGSGRLERFLRRVKRRASVKQQKLTAAREARQVDRAVRYACFLRDRRCCRAYGTPLAFDTDNLFKLAHNHHLVFRSAGGSDGAENRITLSPQAHRLMHGGYLTAEGDGNGAVRFTEYAFVGTAREIVREWVSAV